MSALWRLGGKTLDCSVPRVMAIVNATPDSFFEASRLPVGVHSREAAIAALLAEQPDVIDVGGQSTRPGSLRVDAATEAARVAPVIAELRARDAKVPITVDTYHASVARKALDAGADGVNDISAGRMDPELLAVVKQHACGYVLMHMLGTPESMQQNPQYADSVGEVGAFLAKALAGLAAQGIDPECVVLDPGIGFGKRLEDNLELVLRAGELTALGRPLLYGISRKSFIGKLAGADDPEQRLPGTHALTWELLNRGVMLHRVHDVNETRHICTLWRGLHPQANAGNKPAQRES